MRERDLLALMASVSLILIQFSVGFLLYPTMPEKMVTHWGLSGYADGYGSRFQGLFLIPIASAMMFPFMLALPRLDPAGGIMRFLRGYHWFLFGFTAFMSYVYARADPNPRSSARAHGKSGRAKGYYTMRDYSRDVTALLEDLIQQPTILFGHSLGGWVSLMVACERPETVKALIIGDSPLNLRDFRKVLRGYSERWTTERELTKKTYEELLTDFDAESARRLSLVDPEAFRYWIEGCEDASAFDKLFEGYNISEMLPVIDCPILLLQGNTKALPDKDIEYAKSVLPEIKLVFLTNHGHYLGLDTGDIADLLESVTLFLKSIE